jgi:hypothetical protein
VIVASARCSTRHEIQLTVYGIADGCDPDRASWLLDLSELSDVLSVRPARSHSVHALGQLDRDYTAAQPMDPWDDWYATRLAGLVG